MEESFETDLALVLQVAFIDGWRRLAAYLVHCIIWDGIEQALLVLKHLVGWCNSCSSLIVIHLRSLLMLRLKLTFQSSLAFGNFWAQSRLPAPLLTYRLLSLFGGWCLLGRRFIGLSSWLSDFFSRRIARQFFHRLFRLFRIGSNASWRILFGLLQERGWDVFVTHTVG